MSQYPIGSIDEYNFIIIEKYFADSRVIKVTGFTPDLQTHSVYTCKICNDFIQPKSYSVLILLNKYHNADCGQPNHTHRINTLICKKCKLNLPKVALGDMKMFTAYNNVHVSKPCPCGNCEPYSCIFCNTECNNYIVSALMFDSICSKCFSEYCISMFHKWLMISKLTIHDVSNIIARMAIFDKIE